MRTVTITLSSYNGTLPVQQQTQTQPFSFHDMLILIENSSVFFPTGFENGIHVNKY